MNSINIKIVFYNDFCNSNIVENTKFKYFETGCEFGIRLGNSSMNRIMSTIRIMNLINEDLD